MEKATTSGGLRVRLARHEDVPEIERLIERAVRGLHREDYGEEKLESALRHKLLDVDPGLVSDGTYFVAEIRGRIVGSGGWSLRRNIVNGAENAGEKLDPAAEEAKVRAFYVRPECARMGIGSRILRESEDAAWRGAFRGWNSSRPSRRSRFTARTGGYRAKASKYPSPTDKRIRPSA